MPEDFNKIDLVGLTELASAWGITRQRAQVLSHNKTFPEPAITAKGPNGKIVHRLWLRSEAMAWREKHVRQNPTAKTK